MTENENTDRSAFERLQKFFDGREAEKISPRLSEAFSNLGKATLPHVLAKDEDGDTLSLARRFGGRYVLRMEDMESAESAEVYVDPEALLRNLAQHTPHLRIVDAVEHAPETLEWLEADARTDLYINEHGDVLSSQVTTPGSHYVHPYTGDPEKDGYARALYAGRAPEARDIYETPEELAARIDELEQGSVHDAELVARLEAEVANLRDALDKAWEYAAAIQGNAAATREHADAQDRARATQDHVISAEKNMSEKYRIAYAARQALTETNGEGSDD